MESKKPSGLTNEEALNRFMWSFEKEFPELIAKVENTILENAENLKLSSVFNLEGSDLSRGEQIEMLISLKMYFIEKGFAVSRVQGEEEEAPYITIEILI